MTAMHRHEAESVAAMRAGVPERMAVEQARQYVERGGKLRVLIACEYSATVRDAFRARGFDAFSCDLLPTEGDPRWHIQDDVFYAIAQGGWDLMIAHPPCTHLAVSGARHFAAKQASGVQREALAFVARLLAAPIPHIALENPVSIISSRIRKPDCTFQPWEHGHGEVKRTFLWLKNLPALMSSNVVEGREERVHRMAPGPDRWKERSRTLPGVAKAMADQWGAHIRATAIRVPAPPRASQRDSAALVSSPASAALNVAYSFHSTEIAHD